MKKNLLAFILLFSFGTANAQLGILTNGGFENWTSTLLFSNPGPWVSSNINEFAGTPLTSKSTDAQHLTYSVLLENEVINGDSLFGYVYLGQPNDVDLNGFPYTSDFTAVTGYYKCNMAGNDTAYVIVAKSYMGVAYPPVFGPVYGNVSTWTSFTFPVPAGPCDSVFVGFISSNPFNNANFNPASWVMFDNVAFTNPGPTPAALPNQSFETWTDANVNDPDNWDSFNVATQPAGYTNVAQSTDAYLGTYAAQLETAYIPLYNDTIPGILTNGVVDPSAGIFAIPYTAEPALFSGYYKYTPSGSDIAEVQVIFLQGGSAVGAFYLPITSAAATYTPMGGPLTLSGTPDSMIVIMTSGNNAGSILKVDELSLSGGNVGMQEMAKRLGFKTYPNPTYGEFTLEWETNSTDPVSFVLTDVSGKTVMTQVLNSGAGINTKQLNIVDLAPGLYSYTLMNGDLRKVGKLLKE